MKTCEKFRKIKLLLSDVDGVMNDGRIYYLPTPEGVKVAKFFNVRDGLGVRLLQRAGLDFGIITGRKDKVVETRCRDLGCRFSALGVKDKARKVLEILQEAKLSKEEVAYIGDDWNDLPVFDIVGLSLVPQDAPQEIKERVDFVIPVNGGEGVIRYAVEKILKCKGLFEKAVEEFLASLKG
ncbi:MAG TPA: 3-deoxy-D-manno-octulosonate 8-phosphate phosphatase [Aquifex aeolicus]|uniref:3-deoxy-D-manno-octulosonate 8-phosphate phosphatase KdsC n=1 Tax=Aquifex aeolicus TaxID=63363 RepID=A0A9D0YQE6_AQUAO|nr:3-deoxy-D-manno-octulosonate 8-phosphate phosphatase [Aquificales bacterium]HIP98270.1 3-deoxy-D-manno-octulosonate 8-phosphate phosphatase [Aquifex aeolicus]HIQ26788.1 3-deoxy-D-manno-octulosonate 8-phosphate phosphatase [Aquifex aeolicus]